jgi:hypothetical protein
MAKMCKTEESWISLQRNSLQVSAKAYFTDLSPFKEADSKSEYTNKQTNKQTNKLHDLSPRVNYIGRETAACLPS